jgi:hypothetical protein
MQTLAQRCPEFVTNANGTGMQLFKLHKQGTMPNGKNAYIYIRTHDTGKKQGTMFGVEVIIPNIKKAGTYPLPPKDSGKTITYPEDFEEYPGASLFGKKAWFYQNIPAAERRLESLLKAEAVVEEDESETTPDPDPAVIGGVALAESLAPSRRGRPKVDRPPLNLPDGEFSIKEIAEQNKVEYIVAAQFVKEQETAQMIQRTRTERRATRGPETQLFKKTI